MNCTLCDTPLDNRADEYYFICSTCGAYVKDSEFYVSENQEIKHYEKHNNDVADVRYQNFTSPITNAVSDHHTKEQLGLDYGCGTGPVIAKQLQKKDFQVKLYDPYFYPDLDYLNHQYDYIFSCEVFEHFYHPKQEIEKLLQILKSTGRLYIMTHWYDSSVDFTNWYYRKDPTHVFIYTRETLDFIADKYQLQIEKMTNRLIVLSLGISNSDES